MDISSSVTRNLANRRVRWDGHIERMEERLQNNASHPSP
jgi:hypothetical protein